MSSAIILIDIQNDYFKGGKNELFLTERASENAGRAIKPVLLSMVMFNVLVFNITVISPLPFF